MNKLVVDESVAYEIVEKLKESGFEVLSILEISPGIDDEEVLELALKEEAILVTEDKDFGELTYRLRKSSHGILLIRLIGVSEVEKTKIVIDAVKSHLEDIRNNFAVLSSNKLRIKEIK